MGFACSICDKKYAQQAFLKMHERTHTGERPFACSYCDKAFKERSHLKRHERTHTGEKPFACSTCDKTFINSYNLKIHEMTHTGEKPFACFKCDKSFNQSSNLKRHEAMHTGEKLQPLPKDPLEIKEEIPTAACHLLEIKVVPDNQEPDSNVGVKIENEIFYKDIKQEP